MEAKKIIKQFSVKEHAATFKDIVRGTSIAAKAATVGAVIELGNYTVPKALALSHAAINATVSTPNITSKLLESVGPNMISNLELVGPYIGFCALMAFCVLVAATAPR